MKEKEPFTHNAISNYLLDQGFKPVQYNPKMYNSHNQNSLDFSFNIRVFERADYGRVLLCNTMYSYSLLDHYDHPERIIKIVWFSRIQDNAEILWNARDWKGFEHILAKKL